VPEEDLQVAILLECVLVDLFYYFNDHPGRGAQIDKVIDIIKATAVSQTKFLNFKGKC